MNGITFRNAGAWFVAAILISLGFVARAKKKAADGEFILSIYFHSPGKALFEFCVKWLKKNKFNFLTQQDVLDVYQQKKSFPKSAVIITVDDGWQTNDENIVAIANRYKIPVTIFVATDAIENGNFWWSYISNKKTAQHSIESLKKVPDVERVKTINDIKTKVHLGRNALTVEQLKKIAASDFTTIGSHTVTHPVLINCTDEQVLYELKTSKQIIENWIHKAVTYFAYPNGDYKKREIKYLKESGYALAYTTEPAYLTSACLQNIYQLPRFCVYENISNMEAVCRMTGVWQMISRTRSM